ncbi:deoxyribonuclease IV [Persephonella sp.]
MVRIGAHVSSSKSLDLVFDRGNEIGAETIQFFLSSPRSWAWKERSEREKALFTEKRGKFGIRPVVVHSSYLFNLASGDENLRGKSIQGVLNELRLCEELSIDYYVIHAGKGKNLTDEQAVENIIKSLEFIFSKINLKNTQFLIETLAGQKGEIGKTTQEIKSLIDPFKTENIGVCLDTCHLYSAGYKINDKVGFEEYINEFDQLIGIEKVKVIHCNDSKTPFNSRRDRHEHIGEGSIGLTGFELFLNCEYFKNLPFVIETPKEGDWDIVNMDRLRKLIHTAPVAQ